MPRKRQMWRIFCALFANVAVVVVVTSVVTVIVVVVVVVGSFFARLLFVSFFLFGVVR